MTALIFLVGLTGHLGWLWEMTSGHREKALLRARVEELEANRVETMRQLRAFLPQPKLTVLTGGKGETLPRE